MDPTLAFDAFVTPEHDLFCFGHILKTIGDQLAIPELEGIGFTLLRSSLAERSSGGVMSADRLLTDLRALTFRAGRQLRQTVAQLDCYELSRDLQSLALDFTAFFHKI